MSSENIFRTGKVVTVSFAHLIHDTFSAFLAPLIPLLIEKFALSYFLVGVLNLGNRIPSLFNPFIGIIADYLPVRFIIIITPAITAITMSFLGMSSHFGIAFLLIFVMGTSAAFFHIPAPIMVKKLSGARIGKGMSYFMVGGELARSLGPIIILSAISWWGLEGTWRLAPIGIIFSIYLYFSIGTIKLEKPVPQKTFKGIYLNDVKKHLKVILIIFGITFFTSMVKSAITYYLPTYLYSSGEDLWFSGIALSIVQFAGAAGTFTSGTISDHIGRKNTLLITTILTPIMMWLFILSEGVFTLILLVVLGFFLISANPVLLAMVQELKVTMPSFINGVYFGITFVTGAIAVLLIGLLADVFGLTTTYMICATIAVFAVPVVLLLDTEK